MTATNLRAYALMGLRSERDRLNKLIEDLEGYLFGEGSIVPPPKARRKRSAATRRKMREAQQKRWAREVK